MKKHNFGVVAFIVGASLGASFTMAIYLIIEGFYFLGVSGLIATIIGLVALLVQSNWLDKEHSKDN